MSTIIIHSINSQDNDLVGTIPMNFLKAISSHKPIEVDLSSNNLSGGVPLELDRWVCHSDFTGHSGIIFCSRVLDLSSPLILMFICRLNQLVIYLRDNKFTKLSPTLCDSNNQGWNLRGVEMFGCNAIMCPPGTANYRGRQSGENNPCLKCASNTDLYGQITCDGYPLEASSSARLVQGVVGTVISSLLFGVLLF